MYKAKKKWVIAGVTMFSAVLGTTALASADNVSSAQSSTNSASSQSNISNSQVSQAYQNYVAQKSKSVDNQTQPATPVATQNSSSQVTANTKSSQVTTSQQSSYKDELQNYQAQSPQKNQQQNNVNTSSSYVSIGEQNDPKYDKQVQDYQSEKGNQNKSSQSNKNQVINNEKASTPVKPTYTQTTPKNTPVTFAQQFAATPQARDAQSNVTFGSCNELNQVVVDLKNPISGDLNNQVQFSNGGGIKNVSQNGNQLTITTNNDIDFQKAMTVTVDGQQYTIDPTDGTAMPVVRSQAFDNKYVYNGNDLGATYTKDATTFKIYAPTASGMSVNLFENDTDPNAKLKSWTPMTFDPNTGVWSATIKGDLKDTAYNYHQEFANGKAYEVYDPYATACVEGGFRSVVLSPDEMGPAVTAGKVTDKNDPTDEVIGEIHVRDFTNDPSSGVDSKIRGTYLGAVQPNTTDSKGNPTGLNYLLHQGINTVQIQPMYQYDDDGNNTNKTYQYDWGYDPENYNVPEGWYSTNRDDPATRIKECKEMVQGFHNAGIRVNMDVVYNHVADHSTNALAKTVPGYYFNYGSNGKLTSTSGCGNDVASWRPMARKYILNSVKYWHDNYGIDGFRFDLMGNLDVETMNDIRKELPDVVMYGEGWNMGTPVPNNQNADQANEKEMPTVGTFNGWGRTVLRGDDNGKPYGYVTGNQSQQTMSQLGNFIYGCQNLKNTPSDGVDGGVNYDNPTQVINYAECHDNKTLFDVMKAAHPDESNDLLMRRAELANAISILNEGVPYVQVGQGFGRSKNGDGNSFRSGDAENNIHWDTQDDRTWATAYEKALIQLRNSDPAFRMTTYSDMNNNMKWVEVGSNNGVIGYELTSPSTGKKYIIGYSNNASQQDLTGIPNGNWKVLIKNCNGYLADPQTINVTDGKTDIPSLSCLVLEQDPPKTDTNSSSNSSNSNTTNNGNSTANKPSTNTPSTSGTTNNTNQPSNSGSSTPSNSNQPTNSSSNSTPTTNGSSSNQQGLSYKINVTYKSDGKTVGTANESGNMSADKPVTLPNNKEIGEFINSHVPSGYNKLSDKEALSAASSAKPQDENGTEVYNIEVNVTPVNSNSNKPTSSTPSKPNEKPSQGVNNGSHSSSGTDQSVTKPSTSGSSTPTTTDNSQSSNSAQATTKPSESGSSTPVSSDGTPSSDNHEKDEIGNGAESPSDTNSSVSDSTSSFNEDDSTNDSQVADNHEQDETGNGAESQNNSATSSDDKLQSTNQEKEKTNKGATISSRTSNNNENSSQDKKSPISLKLETKPKTQSMVAQDQHNQTGDRNTSGVKEDLSKVTKPSDNESENASMSSKQVSSQSKSETSGENQIPQTGESSNREGAEIGLAVLGIVGTVGVGLRKKRYE